MESSSTSEKPDKGKSPCNQDFLVRLGSLQFEGQVPITENNSQGRRNNNINFSLSISNHCDDGVANKNQIEESNSTSSNRVSQTADNVKKDVAFDDSFSRDHQPVFDERQTPAMPLQRNSTSGYSKNIWAFDDSLYNRESLSSKSRTNSFHKDCTNSYGSSSSWYSIPSGHSVSNYQNVADGYNSTMRSTIYELKRQDEMRNASLRAQAQQNSSNMAQAMNLFLRADHDQRLRLLSVLRGSILRIMVDKQLHSLFLNVLDLCDEYQLCPIVDEILSNGDLFIRAAFCKRGSSCIARLIRKLKNTDYAFAITSILASRFYDLTTHPTARIVIQQCLYLLGKRPNEVLYEQAVLFSTRLAVDAVGCRFLNECVIDMITDNQRTRLLHEIAHASDFLSHDPFGNYVVQHVLDLKNEMINAEIFSRLRGQFVLLSQKKEGSHVVEKCLESCSIGAFYVVEDILLCKGATIFLALDQFGNYVIQKALKMTRICGFTSLYKLLVKPLERYRDELKRTAGGRQVLSLIMEDEIHYRMEKNTMADNGRRSSV